MSYYSESRLFYINSRNREAGLNTDFTYKFNIDPQSKFDRVVLLDISIPKSFYAIQSTNSFILSENGNQTTISLPPGNYTRQSFKNVLESYLNSNSYYTGVWTYTLSYKSINTREDDGKITYTVSGNSGIQPSFIFGGTETLYEEMGFETNSTNTFITNTITSTNAINLAPENTLFLKSDICQDSDNVLQNIITSNDSSFSVVNFVNPNPREYSKYFVPDKYVYHFRLTDENDNLIDTNGQNIVFTVMLYKSNNVDDYIRRYILLKTFDSNNQKQ